MLASTRPRSLHRPVAGHRRAQHCRQRRSLREAKQAAAAGIRLYTLGVGADPDTFAEAMTPAQAPAQSDPSAELDEALLQQLAEVGHGRYFRARTQGISRPSIRRWILWSPSPPRRPAIVPTRALPLATGAGLAAAELARPIALADAAEPQSHCA